MPAPQNRPKGAPCWTDLFSSDPEKAEHFYGELFGWKAERGDEEKYGGYVTFTKDGASVAGCMRNDGSQGTPDGWTVYLSSDDAGATAKAAAEHGAAVYIEPMEVPDVGTMALVADPGGSPVGIWQAGDFAGFENVIEPGTPNWVELHTRAYADVVSFYQDVFGWDNYVMSDTPEFRYTTLGKDAAAVAGIFDAADLPEDAPMSWFVYWGTTNVDATVAKAEELGGSVLQPAEDTPYGRMATLADPTGATFKVITPPLA